MTAYNEALSEHIYSEIANMLGISYCGTKLHFYVKHEIIG